MILKIYFFIQVFLLILPIHGFGSEVVLCKHVFNPSIKPVTATSKPDQTTNTSTKIPIVWTQEKKDRIKQIYGEVAKVASKMDESVFVDKSYPDLTEALFFERLKAEFPDIHEGILQITTQINAMISRSKSADVLFSKSHLVQDRYNIRLNRTTEEIRNLLREATNGAMVVKPESVARYLLENNGHRFEEITDLLNMESLSNDKRDLYLRTLVIAELTYANWGLFLYENKNYVLEKEEARLLEASDLPTGKTLESLRKNALSIKSGSYESYRMLTSNEPDVSAYGELLTLLRKQTKGGVEGYAGLGAEQNYTLLGFSQPKRGWIYDRNSSVIYGHLLCHLGFSIGKSPREFLAFFGPTFQKTEKIKKLIEGVYGKKLGKKLLSHYNANRVRYYEHFRDLAIIPANENAISKNFLSDENMYNFVRSMVLEGQITLVNLDHSDQNSLIKIGREMKAHQLHADVVYLSNALSRPLLNDYGFATRNTANNILALPARDASLLLSTSEDAFVALNMPETSYTQVYSGPGYSPFQVFHYSSTPLTGYQEAVQENIGSFFKRQTVSNMVFRYAKKKGLSLMTDVEDFGLRVLDWSQ